MADRLAKKVLLIGWDAADWQIIQPMLAEGLMPTLSQFINEGVIGNLATLRPVLSPMLWNSIATGKRPDKHGIFGFIEPRADGTGIQPVSSTSRKTKAIWNILTQSEMTSSIVAWYASHPAEPIRGACVSEFFSRLEWTADKKEHVAAHSIHPERLVEPLSHLRLHQEDIGPWHLAPFVPTLGEIPAEETPPVTGLQ
jgi:predicted AlkP superfamily phosphohydrolase/phosphomutase